MLTARRDEAAARRFFEHSINLHDLPEKITIDKIGANTAAVRELLEDSGLAIEQHHHAVNDSLRTQSPTTIPGSTTLASTSAPRD